MSLISDAIAKILFPVIATIIILSIIALSLYMFVTYGIDFMGDKIKDKIHEVI